MPIAIGNRAIPKMDVTSRIAMGPEGAAYAASASPKAIAAV